VAEAQFPTDPDELARSNIELPRLKPDSAASAPKRWRRSSNTSALRRIPRSRPKRIWNFCEQVGYEVNYDGLTPEQFMLAESRGWI
jgi:hypothetical protein